MSDTATEVRSESGHEKEPGRGWSFLDMVLAVVLGGIAGVIAILLFRLGAALAHAHFTRIQTLAIASTLLYAGIALGVWLLVVRRRRVGWGALGLRPVSPAYGLLALGAFVALEIVNVIVAYGMTAALGQFKNPQVAQITAGGRISESDFVWLLIMVAVVAPIVEETVFRGMFYRYLRARTGIVVAVLLSAAVFAAAHGLPILLPLLFTTGIALAIVAQVSDSIIPSMIVHGLNNGLFTLILYASLHAAR